MAGSSFVFDQPDVLLTADLSLAKKLIDFTDIQDDGYIRGVLTSDSEGGCSGPSLQPSPYCTAIWGGYPANPTFVFNFHNKFKKAKIVAIEKLPGKDYIFDFDSREVINKFSFDSQAISAGDVASTFWISRSKSLKYIGGNANNTVLIGSSSRPLIDNAKTKTIDLEFGNGDNNLQFDTFQGPNKKLTQLTAVFGAGDDLIDFNSGYVDPVFFSKKISIQAGAGDDKINQFHGGGLLAGKKINIDLGDGADGMSFGVAAHVASKVKSVKINLGKDDDRDFVRIYVPRSFDQSLITFKNERDEDSVDIWMWGQDDPRGQTFA